MGHPHCFNIVLIDFFLAKKDARANKETGWDGKNPLFKRRQEMNSPLTKHGDLEPELSKCQDIPAKQDDSCVFFKRHGCIKNKLEKSLYFIFMFVSLRSPGLELCGE